MQVMWCLCLVTYFLSCSDTVLAGRTKRNAAMDKMAAEIEMLKKALSDLSKHVMFQQFAAEERVRNEGYSGVQVIRGMRRGKNNYDSSSHVNPAAFAIHDHSNYDRTIGIGEISAVLNGVDFRTRHNDYKLMMASTTSKGYRDVENIPFPEVPPEVLAKSSISAQVEEMAEYFRAFRDQNSTHRDYRPYFKPVLCYMEGSWTLDKDLVEPFPSDRHGLNAYSWEDLHSKIRFAAYTGISERMQNIAYLPKTIISVDPVTGLPVYAQWNYRIICHPLKFDISLSHLKQVNDLSYRLSSGQSTAQVLNTRSARYQLYDDLSGSYQLLDKIFADIPGMDNHGGNLTMTAFDEDMFDPGQSSKQTRLNSAYYYRLYNSALPGALGESSAGCGYNDANLWVAQTTQPKIAPVELEKCEIKNKMVIKTNCQKTVARFSYAIPLELIYMTPLLSWNPHNFKYHDNHRLVTHHGRDGKEASTAFNGGSKMHYYRTPEEFYAGGIQGSQPADTERSYVWVLDDQGVPRRVSASGTKIITQEIRGGVGKIRLRYPIAPVHYEGSSVWKELNALKATVHGNVENPPSVVEFRMRPSSPKTGSHTHDFTLTYNGFRQLIDKQNITVTTEEAHGHTHHLQLAYDRRTHEIRFSLCDGERSCPDLHGKTIDLLTKNRYTELTAEGFPDEKKTEMKT